jgi:hypothetical protein
MLSSVPVTRAARFLIIGDSLNDPALPYHMMAEVQANTDKFYRRWAGAGYNGKISGGGASQVTPAWISTAVNGSTIAQVQSRTAADLAKYNPTHVICCCGTNERAQDRVTQTQPAITGLAGLFTTQYVLLIGPYAWGEKWPSGQNDVAGANDTRLDETDTDLETLFVATYANVCYVSPRQYLYAGAKSFSDTVAMPTLNTPSPGVTVGPYTTPDASGAHYNGTGRHAVTLLCEHFIVRS